MPNAPAGTGNVTNASGQQVAQSDGLSSGEASNRPQMNAKASQAYDAGSKAFQAGDLDTAKSKFQEATAADPKAYRAFFSLGVVLERLGDTTGAQSAYQKAVAAVPDYENAMVAYALLLARTNRETEGEQYLRTQQAKMPKSAAIVAGLAELKSMMKDSGEAQRLAQEALKKNPNYKPAMITLARDHYRNRRLDLALYTLKAILDGFGEENPPRDKNNAEARLLRGLILKEMGRRGAAIEEFEKAEKLRPDLVEARVNLAAYLLESGNAKKAAELLEGAIKYHRTHLEAHLNLGDAYRLLGKYGDALKEFDWVKTQDATMAEVYYNVGLLYLFAPEVPGVTKLQAAERAMASLQKYKELRSRPKPGDPDDVDELITRAKTKKSIIEAEQAAPPPPPPPPPAEGEGGDSKPAEGADAKPES